MKEKLTNNLGLKIISVFLSYIVLHAGDNNTNPDSSD